MAKVVFLLSRCFIRIYGENHDKPVSAENGIKWVILDKSLSILWCF